MLLILAAFLLGFLVVGFVLLVKIYRQGVENHRQGECILVNVSDVKAKADALKAQVEASITIEQSTILLVQGMAATEADLAAKLAAAIAAGGDPVALQDIADELQATSDENKASSDALATAVVANTPPAAPTS